MDGKFVPNFTLGPDLIKRLREFTEKPFDIHLMVEKPEDFLNLFIESGADMISVHAESTNHLQRTLQTIKDRGLKAGVAINPATSIHDIEYVLDVVDYITVMTVNPGFAGQRFVPLMNKKLADLTDLINENGYRIDVQVDGNIGYETIPDVLKNGANMRRGTSSLFKPNLSLELAVSKLRSFIEDIGVNKSIRM